MACCDNQCQMICPAALVLGRIATLKFGHDPQNVAVPIDVQITSWYATLPDIICEASCWCFNRFPFLESVMYPGRFLVLMF
jgi:hypothetical protein